MSHNSAKVPTALERHLAGAGAEQVSPLDAFKAARHKFVQGERIDMAELAAELGVGRATLYRWVGGRDRLLGEILWSLTEIGIRQARDKAKGRGVTWVLDVYRRLGEMIVHNEPLRTFIEREPECALRVMTTKHSPHQARMVDAWAEILREAVETRGLKLRVDPQTLGFVLVRVAESFLWTDLITGESPDLTKAHEVARVLLS